MGSRCLALQARESIGTITYLKAATAIKSVMKTSRLIHHVQDKAMLGLEVAILDGLLGRG